MSRRASFRSWYEENQETLAAKRKEKYRSSKDEKEKARAQARAYRERRKNGESVQRETYRLVNGKQVRVFTTGAVADRIGTYPMMLINWERRGWIPESSFGEKHRLYTQNQVVQMKKLLSAVQTKNAKRISTAIEKVHNNWD